MRRRKIIFFSPLTFLKDIQGIFSLLVERRNRVIFSQINGFILFLSSQSTYLKYYFIYKKF